MKIMQKTKLTKLLCLVLSLVMILGMAPLTVFAEEHTHTYFHNKCTVCGAYHPDFVVDENDVLTGYDGAGSDVIIPDGIKAIGEKAFYHKDIVQSLVIPASVESIGEYAFGSDCRLSYVYFLEGSKLKTIDSNAFSECGTDSYDYTGLDLHMYIPESVTSDLFTSTSATPFYHCKKVYLHLAWDSAEEIVNCDNLKRAIGYFFYETVPAGTLDLYNATNWSTTKSVTEHTHSFTGAYFDLGDGTHCQLCECCLYGGATKHTYTNGVCACGAEEPAHDHSFAAEWSSDEGGHWHACSGTGICDIEDYATCGLDGAAYAAHTDENGDFYCDVCDYYDEAAVLAAAKAEAKITVSALAGDDDSAEVSAIIEKALEDIENAISTDAVEAITAAAEIDVAEQRVAGALAAVKAAAIAAVNTAAGSDNAYTAAIAAAAAATINNAATVDAVNAEKEKALAAIDLLKNGSDDTALKEAQAALAEAQAALAEAQATITDKPAALAEANSKLNAAEANVASLTGELNTANTALTKANADLTAAKAQVTSLTADIDKANADLTKANNDLAAANTELAAVKSAKSAIEAQLTAALAELEALKAASGGDAEAITKLTAEVEELKAAIAVKEADITAKAKTIADLEKDVDTLEKTVDEKEATFTAKTSEITSLTAAAAALEKTVAEKDEAISDLTAQLAAAKAEIEKLKNGQGGSEDPADPTEPGACKYCGKEHKTVLDKFFCMIIRFFDFLVAVFEFSAAT